MKGGGTTMWPAIMLTGAGIVVAAAAVLRRRRRAPADPVVPITSTFTAQVGEAVAIPLRGNETTPYRWFLEPMQGVELIDEHYRSDPSRDMICGIPGTRTFTLRATRKGRYRLHFRHAHIEDRDFAGSAYIVLIAR